jgi:hypothetical protein
MQEKQKACEQDARRPYTSGLSSKHIAQGSGAVAAAELEDEGEKNSEDGD